jgi:DNA-binding PadR family transcriptional regulator
MGDQTPVGEFEQLVLLAVLQLGDGAYGVPVRREIEKRVGRKVSRGAVYTTLDRLEGKGLLSSWLGEPTPERSGKAKRFYRVERAGIRALKESRTALRKMWAGLETVLGEL